MDCNQWLKIWFQIGQVFLSRKPFDDKLQPSWILALGLAETGLSECYWVTGRGYGSYQFENGITWKWDNGGQEQKWQKGHPEKMCCTGQEKTWTQGEDMVGCQFLPNGTLPSKETSPEWEPLKNDGCRWMKSALDMFNFSFKWSHMLVPKSNISIINNILDCQLRPGGFLKALCTFSFNPRELSVNCPQHIPFSGCCSWDMESFNKLPEVLDTLGDGKKIQI